MEEEKRYKIIEIQNDLRENKKMITIFSTTSIVYAGLSALLLYIGIDKINNDSYLAGILTSYLGTSIGVSDLFVIKMLRAAIEDYISEREELDNLKR